MLKNNKKIYPIIWGIFEGIFVSGMMIFIYLYKYAVNDFAPRLRLVPIMYLAYCFAHVAH